MAPCDTSGFALATTYWILISSVFLIRNLFQYILENLMRLCADNRITVIDHISWHTGYADLIRPPHLIYNRGHVFFIFHLMLHFIWVQINFLRGRAKHVPLTG